MLMFLLLFLRNKSSNLQYEAPHHLRGTSRCGLFKKPQYTAPRIALINSSWQRRGDMIESLQIFQL